MADKFSVVISVCAFDAEVEDPDALLDSYHAPDGWADAVTEAGADAVTVVQRFSRNALIRRGRVDYHFVADGAPPSPAGTFWGSRMTHTIQRLAPTVVHIDGLVFPLIVRHLRLRLHRQTALAVQDHGGLDVQSPSFQTHRWRALYRFGLGAADGFLFTARDQASPFLRAGIIGSSDAIHEVLESSTNLASWPLGTDAGYRLPGQPALLWVGRLDSNKDPLTVLDGFERVAEALPNAALTLVYGDDILLAEVTSRIASSPLLRSRVHLRGRMPQSALPGLYAGADLFVLGSHREVACFSLIEALSFGVTPVVTDIPPFRAITDHGRLGPLFPPGDASAFARAIQQVAGGDLAARRSFVRGHFARELSWPAVGRRALSVYRALAKARKEVIAEWTRCRTVAV